MRIGGAQSCLRQSTLTSSSPIQACTKSGNASQRIRKRMRTSRSHDQSNLSTDESRSRMHPFHAAMRQNHHETSGSSKASPISLQYRKSWYLCLQRSETEGPHHLTAPKPSSPKIQPSSFVSTENVTRITVPVVSWLILISLSSSIYPLPLTKGNGREPV